MNPCDSLDDFLDGQLAERAAFVGHLSGCDDCRDAVRLHELLADAVEAVPVGLTCNVRRKLTRARQRRWAAVGSLAASLLVGVWLAWPSEHLPPIETIALAPEPPPVEVVAHFEGDVIVRPMETGEPTVTAYWIYTNLARNTKKEDSR